MNKEEYRELLNCKIREALKWQKREESRTTPGDRSVEHWMGMVEGLDIAFEYAGYLDPGEESDVVDMWQYIYRIPEEFKEFLKKKNEQS